MERTAFNLKRACALIFGALLWIQLAAGGLSAELSFEDPDGRRLVVAALPLALLFVMGFARSRVVALLLFPTSFGAVLVVMPQVPDGGSESPLAFVLACATLLIYVVAASAWLHDQAGPVYLETTRRSVTLKRDRWRPYRGTFLPRAILLLGIFLVSAAAVPLYSPLRQRVTEAFGHPADPSAGEQGLVLVGLVMFFIWSVVAYGLFFSPAVENEARIRHLETRMQASVTPATGPGRKAVFALTVAAALVLMALLVLLR